jgi:hypothetical protein
MQLRVFVPVKPLLLASHLLPNFVFFHLVANRLLGPCPCGFNMLPAADACKRTPTGHTRVMLQLPSTHTRYQTLTTAPAAVETSCECRHRDCCCKHRAHAASTACCCPAAAFASLKQLCTQQKLSEPRHASAAAASTAAAACAGAAAAAVWAALLQALLDDIVGDGCDGLHLHVGQGEAVTGGLGQALGAGGLLCSQQQGQ